MIVGPLRAGKGTIARVLTGLLGKHNFASPTLQGLTMNFGLAPLIGKPLALISDAHLSSRSDGTTATDRLLAISGEDSMTIDRKYLEPWTGRLPTRFVIMTNTLPRFNDSSGALPSRFIVLVLTRSYYDEEDEGLTTTLLAEAPGIFNWCLGGLDRLAARGHFVEPGFSREAKRRLYDLAQLEGAFVRDRCEVGEGFEIDKDELWAAWKEWCDDGNKDRPGTKNVFASNLMSAFPGIRPDRVRSGDGRKKQVYRGIRLQQQSDGTLADPGQAVPGQGVARNEVGETPRSEDVARVGQGSSALFSHTEGSPEWYREQRRIPPENPPGMFDITEDN